MTCQLWKEAYCHSGETLEELAAACYSLGEDNDSNNYAVSESCDQVDVDNENEKDVKDLSYKWHPFGEFNYGKGYMVR